MSDEAWRVRVSGGEEAAVSPCVVRSLERLAELNEIPVRSLIRSLIRSCRQRRNSVSILLSYSWMRLASSLCG